MEIDWNVVRERFSGMSGEELLEEAALHADGYEPRARRLLEDEVLARGISPSQIEARRGTDEVPDDDGVTIDVPALLTSAAEKDHVLDLAKTLRGRGIAAIVRELDPEAFHRSGHIVGRWGLMVSGPLAREAAAVLESIIPHPAQADNAAAGCGCGSCTSGCEPSGDEWPEDGDWWKTDPSGAR